MGDHHYYEARPGFNALGSQLAEPGEECGRTYLGGWSAAFMCALPAGHTGSHESSGGTSWGADPKDEQ